MRTSLKLTVVAAAALTIAGCTEEGKAIFNQEAGSQLDTGDFGNATMHNMIAQSCRGFGKGPKAGMVTDPVVVLDPKSTPQRPIYRVHCNGQLNGKYAQVIFREYINSAVPPPDFGIEVSPGAAQ